MLEGKVRRGPEYHGREPAQIISEQIYFDSVGYTYRGLSWLDLAIRESNVCTLQYAALDVRQAIECLIFEEIVFKLGSEFDRDKYNQCKGNATKLKKILRKLNPDYDKLGQFAKAIASLSPQAPPIVTWDIDALMKHWGSLSNLLHWAGEPADTFESETWFGQGVEVVESAANSIWSNNEMGYTGCLRPESMQPEIKATWEEFRDGKIDIEVVILRARIASPVLESRQPRWK